MKISQDKNYNICFHAVTNNRVADPNVIVIYVCFFLQSFIMKSSKEAVQAAAKEFLTFVNKGVSPYHGKKAASYNDNVQRNAWKLEPHFVDNMISQLYSLTRYESWTLFLTDW